MVRSMYSGVAGMRAQQSAMDTIGNNIANVKTYGYKASRTTFRDVYYQTISSGSGATGNRGGTNPSQIGYGAQLGSIDVLHGQSSFAMTGRSMDMAIAGEGFFQVMDADGNMFYTRAGQIDFDPEGNLVDVNGNFVLGVSGDPLGRTGSNDKIQMSIPPVSAHVSGATEKISNRELKITTTKNNEAGNVAITFREDTTLPGGMPCKAVFTGGGTGITINLNPSETFPTVGDLQKAVNDAITEANGGKEHPAGQFLFEFTPAADFNNLTGAQIVSKDYAVTPGKFNGTWPADMFGGMEVKGTSNDFNGSGAVTFNNATRVPATGVNADGSPVVWTVSMTMGGKTYTGTIDSNRTAAGEFLLKATAPSTDTDTITMSHPGFTKLEDLDVGESAATPPVGDGTLTAPAGANVTAVPAEPSKNLGFGSKAIKLTGGTEGGPQTMANLDSYYVSSDGVIVAKHAVHGEIPVGRIDLVTFANPQGLIQAGNTYFQQGPNTGVANISQPGRNGAGELATGSLEQSSVDLSQEFSDMITTQRAYQANSRIITVSDTMLEELVNLKR